DLIDRGCIWLGSQLHIHIFEQAVRFAMIALATSDHDVQPRIRPTTDPGKYVIPSHLLLLAQIRLMPPTILAGEVVPKQQITSVLLGRGVVDLGSLLDDVVE